MFRRCPIGPGHPRAGVLFSSPLWSLSVCLLSFFILFFIFLLKGGAEQYQFPSEVCNLLTKPVGPFGSLFCLCCSILTTCIYRSWVLPFAEEWNMTVWGSNPSPMTIFILFSALLQGDWDHNLPAGVCFWLHITRWMCRSLTATS